MRIFPLLCATTALVMPMSAYAQQITTEISGQVTNEAGVPLTDATVVVTDTRTGAARTTTTNSDGRFTATNLSTGGPYTVTATADGYQGQTVDQIITNLQGTTQLTFSLATAADEAGEQTVVVTGTRARITQVATGPGTSFGTAVLEAAPTFNRDVRDVIRIDPRVSLDRDDSGSGQDRISCLGGNDRGNSFTVDGIAQGDIYGLNDTGFSSRSSTPVPYDAVRETQVQFAPFDVDFGQFTGCAINVVTKAGTNRFHGGAFYEYSDDGLRGNSVDGRPVGPVQPDKRWGVSFGGPIFRDRLFFFGAYEHQESASSQDEGPTGADFANPVAGVSVAQFEQISDILNRVYGIDTGGIATSRPFTNDRWFGRVDWHITDNHRLELTYQRLEESTVRFDDFFTGSTPQVTGLNTFYNSGTNSNYYSARLYSQWSENLSTEIRYSLSKIRDLQDPVGGGEAQSANPIPRIIVGIDNPPGTPDATILAGPGTSRSANDLQTEIQQFRAVANYNAGSHRLKLGMEINHADIFNLFVQNATGTLVFRNAADLEAGLLSPGTGANQTSTLPANVISGATEGAFGNFSATGDVNDAAAAFSRSIYSVYAQDEWQATDQLSIVAGLRFDFFDGGRPDLNPNFLRRYGIPNNTGFSDVDPVFLPRLAFTYNIDEFSFFSRAQLRGGVGVFSGGDPLVWFGNAFQNDGSGFALGSTQAAGCPAGQIDVVVNGQFTGVPGCFQAAASATAAASNGFTQSIDPDIKMPTVLRANLGFQADLDFAPTGFLSGWHLNLDYIYSRYIDPFTIVDLSQVPDPRGGAFPAFAIDGRPIYRTIDPLNAGCTAQLVDITPTPTYTGVNAACFTTAREDELMLTNSDGYSSHIASIILTKNVDSGIFTSGGSSYFTFGYSYTNAQDRRNLFNSTATSNYDLTAAFDRQNPAASRGFYESRHNITFSGSFREQFFDDLDTSLNFTFVARSGRPYSLTFGGPTGVFNDAASGANNSLLYIPTGPSDPNIAPGSSATAVQQLVDFASSLKCARDFIGRTIERNTCTNDWYYDLDLSISQELPGPGRLFGIGGIEDTIRVYAMFDNFLNLLDSGWNIQRRRNFSGLQDVATATGVDSQGRYIITAFNGVADFNADNLINVSSSVWRIKFGISYNF